MATNRLFNSKRCLMTLNRKYLLPEVKMERQLFRIKVWRTRSFLMLIETGKSQLLYVLKARKLVLSLSVKMMLFLSF